MSGEISDETSEPAANLRLSVLDVTPVSAGAGSGETLGRSLELARHAEALGYLRYWFAEHHNTAMLASAVPEIMIARIAAVTDSLRVGAGGVMLPNHAPLRVAESFRLLETLYPGRIDLGIGRAPGTDQLTALALRRSRAALSAADFPEQLEELLGFLGRGFEPRHPLSRIQAMPTDAAATELWLLGSSTDRARLAAEKGLSFAYAHFISPEPALAALQLYHARFEPSAELAAPRALLAVSAVCADSDAAAEELAASVRLGFLQVQQGLPAAPLPSPAAARAYRYSAAERELLAATASMFWIGSPASLRRSLAGFAHRAGVSELMVTSLIHSHTARLR
ncbi:MAG: LLM class flavin-dependent oxidoreductase, partial [Candidatus Sericytochromatia bacterium]